MTAGSPLCLMVSSKAHKSTLPPNNHCRACAQIASVIGITGACEVCDFHFTGTEMVHAD